MEGTNSIVNREKPSGMTENRLSGILRASLIKATDTYQMPPEIIWVENSCIATLGNFSASTGKAKAKKTFNVSALVAASLANGRCSTTEPVCLRGNARYCMSIQSKAVTTATMYWNEY